MRHLLLLALFLCCIKLVSQAQIAVGPGTPSPDVSAMLDVQSTTSGLLIPRMTAAQRSAIATPATSLMVYQTDVTAGYYFYDGAGWQLLATGSGGTGYVQNQLAADQAAGFRINSNGLFNGGQVSMGTLTPALNSVLTIRAGTTAASTFYPNDYLVGIDLTMQGLATSGTGIRVTTANQNFNNFTSTHSSNSTSNAYYAVGSLLTGIPTSVVSGYLGYRGSGGTSYGVYGVNGTPSVYATSATSWAGFFQGRTVISSESSPGSAVGTDLEVRNTTPGSVSPATISLRQTTSNITGSTVLANLNFGDNYTTNPQAQIQVLRDAASSAATDLPTAITFKTIADNDAAVTLTERIRISNNGNVGINQPTPDASAILDITSASKGVRFPQVVLTAANAAGPVTLPAPGLVVYNTATAGIAPNDVIPGYYYNAGTSGSPSWKRLATSSSAGDAWVTTGNNNTTSPGSPATYGTSTFTAGQNFIGTSIASDLVFGTSNIERMRLQSGGNLTIGDVTNGARLDVHQATATAVARFTNYGNSAIVEFRRTAGTQVAPTPTTASGTILGRIVAQGYDGGGFTPAASITFETDAGGGTTADMPGRIVFNTTLDGTGSVAERMRIDNAGKVGINLPNAAMRLDVTDASVTPDNATVRGVATGAARVYGVLGTSSSNTTNASGVRGFASGTSGANNGVWGESASSSGRGVVGYGTGDGGIGVYGLNNSTGAVNNQVGLYGEKNGATVTGTGYGVWGTSSGSGSVNIGGYFVATGATNSIALRLGASAAGFVNISPASSTTSYSLILPNAAPIVAGSILSSSTAGVMSWATVSSLGSSFVDLSNIQTATGEKTWSSLGTFSGGVTVNGATNINASNNAITNIATGTTASAVNIGNASNSVSLSGGTNLVTGVTNVNLNNNAATNINTGTSNATVSIGGSAAQTIAIADNAAGVKTVNIGNTVAGTSVNIKAGTSLNVSANLSLTSIGNKITIATGANASIGTATLAAGSITVTTTAVSSSSIIMVTVNTPGGTTGTISVPSAGIIDGTSFVINSSSAAETSSVNWWIVN